MCVKFGLQPTLWKQGNPLGLIDYKPDIGLFLAYLDIYHTVYISIENRRSSPGESLPRSRNWSRSSVPLQSIQCIKLRA